MAGIDATGNDGPALYSRSFPPPRWLGGAACAVPADYVRGQAPQFGALCLQGNPAGWMLLPKRSPRGSGTRFPQPRWPGGAALAPTPLH